MAVTTKRAFLQGMLSWYFSAAGNVRLMHDISLCLEIEREKRVFAVELLFKKGYESDGLSRPDFVAKWIKKFDKENSLYNFAGFAHDWLYSRRGFLSDLVQFSRSECDDVFRGILREAGVSRFKAGIMDLAVGLFAGGSKHWGDDSLGSRNKVICSKIIFADGGEKV